MIGLKAEVHHQFQALANSKCLNAISLACGYNGVTFLYVRTGATLMAFIFRRTFALADPSRRAAKIMSSDLTGCLFIVTSLSCPWRRANKSQTAAGFDVSPERPVCLQAGS
jgi:hypothetical protein